MIYFSDKELDELLLEDAYRGDLTTQSLSIGNHQAQITFKRKQSGVVAGIAVVEKLCHKLNLSYESKANDGEYVTAQQVLLVATGRAAEIHQLWKAAQLVLEWCCGVAHYTAEMVKAACTINPQAVVACTRKSIPYTRKLATYAVLCGGGHIHRQGLSETILLFTNHRNLWKESTDWQAMIAQLKLAAPENKITVEADNFTDFLQILPCQADIIQLDKFSLEEAAQAVAISQKYANPPLLSVAGGIKYLSPLKLKLIIIW